MSDDLSPAPPETAPGADAEPPAQAAPSAAAVVSGGAASRRQMALAAARSVATSVVLVTLYYVLPFDGSFRDTWVRLLLGLIVLVALITWQLHAIINSRFPGIRAVESLAFTLPLFLTVFASTYYVMSRTQLDSFNSHLTRTDSLYFTITTFATVGFGDVHAASQTARVVVMVQMVLDLIILGAGIRVFSGAVRRGQERRETSKAVAG